MLLGIENSCGIPLEKIPFEMFGLCLQEPMALITNWLIATTAFILYIRMKKPQNQFQKHWKYFYITFGISTFFGGLGHLFFNYFEVYGKFPCWFFGVIAAYHAGKAMISNALISKDAQLRLTYFLILKGIVLGTLAITMKSFVFVMVDAVITYLFFCLGFGLYYWKKGFQSYKFTVLAVLILIPSIFIFTLKINPHLWFNKDDLSHVLMITTIIFFYLGISKSKELEIPSMQFAKGSKEYVKK